MTHIRTTTGELFYRVQGNGPAVLLLHGRYSTQRSWFHQVVALREHHTVITWDAPGHGNSTVDRAVGLSEHVDAVEALVDHLGLSSVAIVGQSMGGLPALMFALSQPERTWALVLSHSPAGLDDAELVRLTRAAADARLEIPVSERTFRPTFRAERPELVDFSNAEMEASPDFPSSYLDPLFVGGGPHAAQLASLVVPTLVLSADHDVLVPPAVARRVHSLVPGSDLALITDSGHCSWLERPVEYNRIVGSFLARHRPPG